jgi:hypothetical protein
MATPRYRVAHLSRVARQMRELTKRAASLGIKPELMAAFETLDEQLHTGPLALGEPVHRTKRRGGVVCVAVIEPISVRFAVLEREKVVFLLDVHSRLPVSSRSDGPAAGRIGRSLTGNDSRP